MISGQDFRHIWGHRWWLMAAMVLAGVAGFLFSTTQHPVYEAKALGQIVSGRQVVGEFVSPDELLRLTNLYAQIGRSIDPADLTEAAASAGPAPPVSVDELKRHVRVQPEPEVELLRFTGSSDSPERAAQYANAFAARFAQFVDRVQTEQRNRVLTQIQQRVAAIQIELNQRPLAITDTSAAALQVELQALQTRAAEERARPGDSIRVIQNAVSSSTPVSPKPLRDALLAAVAVGVLVAVAFHLWWRLSDHYSSAEEVSSDLGLSLLGEVPRLSRDDVRLVEAFRSVRVAVEFAFPSDEEHRTILVTSAEARAGKSFVTENLALAFAADGRQTIVVDSDLYRPTLHSRFAIPQRPGLADVLVSEASDAIRPTTVNVPGLAHRRGTRLDVLPAGVHFPGTSEALSAPRMEWTVSVLRANYDVMVLDSPPVLASVDALILAQHAGGVVLVVDARNSRRRNVRRALQTLAAVDALVLGFVFNRTTRVDRTGYEYYAEAQSSVEEEARRSRRGGPVLRQSKAGKP